MNDKLEKVAEAVHNAWHQEKIKQGVTDHPDMIPYNDLAENVKEYDRVTARAVMKALPELQQDWIPVSEWLPEDTYSSAEMMNEWFLITTPYGEMKLVQRQKCVPEGFIWFDGYNSYGAVAWKKEELYKID